MNDDHRRNVVCIDPDTGELKGSFELGLLSPEEKRQFETHLLECDRCFQELYRSAPVAELTRGTGLGKEDMAKEKVSRPRSPRPRFLALAAVAATVIVIGIGIVFLPSSQQQPDEVRPEIERIAAIEAPQYAPKKLRSPGDESERVFREAMAIYQDGNYAGAIPALENAAELNPRSAKILFYLGACYLLTDQPAPAAETLARNVELGQTPYLGWARLYRAKALLRLGKLDAAREELQQVVALGTELELDAQRILDELPR
jgi:tetratricopeptide (TPR) repeat protein